MGAYTEGGLYTGIYGTLEYQKARDTRIRSRKIQSSVSFYKFFRQRSLRCKNFTNFDRNYKGIFYFEF